MFPLEEGFGEPWFPIVKKDEVTLCERFRFEGVSRFASASILVSVRGRPFSGQHHMTYRSVEAERGCGSI